MNVIIVAVCVNIALVNANDDIDLDTIIRILKGRRFTYKPGRAHESTEAMHIIPGFYLETPKTVSKSLFRYPKSKHSNAYGRFNMVDANRHDDKKSLDSSSNSRNEHVTSKILKAVKSLDRFRAKKKYANIQAGDRSLKSDEQLLVENLLNNIILGEKNINNNRGSGNDKSEEIDPIIGSKKAATLLVEKLLANVLNEISTNNAFEDTEPYKYGTTKENIWSSGARYGNILANVLNGITTNNAFENTEPYKYGTTKENLRSSGARYGNILQQILEAAQNNNHYQGKGKGSSLIVVETKPLNILRTNQKIPEDILNDSQSTSLNNDLVSRNRAVEIENNANEILDDLVEDDDEFIDTYYGFHHHTRRKGVKDKDCKDDDSLSDDTKEESSEQEKNPGNPFTVHKNKYKQNWLWNHYMDGDHMNINPHGPQFASLGPSGPELFFGRKWWYFNQDDYKPMG